MALQTESAQQTQSHFEPNYPDEELKPKIQRTSTPD